MAGLFWPGSGHLGGSGRANAFLTYYVHRSLFRLFLRALEIGAELLAFCNAPSWLLNAKIHAFDATAPMHICPRMCAFRTRMSAFVR